MKKQKSGAGKKFGAVTTATLPLWDESYSTAEDTQHRVVLPWHDNFKPSDARFGKNGRRSYKPTRLDKDQPDGKMNVFGMAHRDVLPFCLNWCC